MEFTKDDIIKALRCCAEVDKFCGDCPLCENCGQGYLENYAIDIIKDLSEEVEILEAKNKVNDRVGAEYIKALEENKRLKEELSVYYRWIPIEESLPDPKLYDWVLGAVKCCHFTEPENYYLPPHVVEYRDGLWWAMGDEFHLKELHCKVTHWMPLPPLPEGCK